MKFRYFSLFTLPSVLTMTALLVLPLAYTLLWSVQDVTYGRPGRFVGLANYTDTLTSPRFQRSAIFTVGFTLVVTALLLVVGYALALLLHSAKRLRTLFLGLLMVPYVVPVVVGALALAWLFNDAYGGPVSGVLGSLGVDVGWLSESWPARILLVVHTVWNQAAFAALILLAGLTTVPVEHLEAASIDGAGWWGQQRHVVLPALSRLLLLITLISVMDNLRVFDQIQTITPASQVLGTESIMVYVYNVALGESTQLGLASAISVLTMLLTFVILIPLLRRNYRDLRST